MPCASETCRLLWACCSQQKMQELFSEKPQLAIRWCDSLSPETFQRVLRPHTTGSSCGGISSIDLERASFWLVPDPWRDAAQSIWTPFRQPSLPVCSAMGISTWRPPALTWGSPAPRPPRESTACQHPSSAPCTHWRPWNALRCPRYVF
jgi:hypothetical protein